MLILIERICWYRGIKFSKIPCSSITKLSRHLQKAHQQNSDKITSELRQWNESKAISDLGRRSALVLNGDVKSDLGGRWCGDSELKHCAVEIHKVLASKSFGLREIHISTWRQGCVPTNTCWRGAGCVLGSCGLNGECCDVCSKSGCF